MRRYVMASIAIAVVLTASIAILVVSKSTGSAQVQKQLADARRAWTSYHKQLECCQVDGKTNGLPFRVVQCNDVVVYERADSSNKFDWIAGTNRDLVFDLQRVRSDKYDLRRHFPRVNADGKPNDDFHACQKGLLEEVNKERFALLHVWGRSLDEILADEHTTVESLTEFQSEDRNLAKVIFTTRTATDASREASRWTVILDPEKHWTVVRYEGKWPERTVHVTHETSSFRGVPVSQRETIGSAIGPEEDPAVLITLITRSYQAISREEADKKFLEAETMIEQQ